MCSPLSLCKAPIRCLILIIGLKPHRHTSKTMKRIIQMAIACLTTSTAIAAGLPSTPVFQLHLVADSPSAKTESMTLTHLRNGETNRETLYVYKTVALDQTALKSARAIPGTRESGFRIEIKFTEEGKKEFAELTRRSIGKRLAIVIDGQLCSAPVIRDEISGGVAEISGTFTEKQASSLATRITESITPP